VARKISWRELGVVLERLQPGWALAAWLLSFFVIVGLTLRWRILLSLQGIHLPARTIFALTWAGQFFNSILPGSTGGDVMKIYQLCRIAPDKKAAAAASVFVDRLIALSALLVLALVGFILEPLPLHFMARPDLRMASLIACLAAGLAVGIMGIAWRLFRLYRHTRWVGRLQRTLSAAKANFVFGPKLLAAAALAAAVHATSFFVVYLFARSLGIDISCFQVLLMMPVVLFLVLLPVTINGHGLRELLLIGYFTHFSIGLKGAGPSGVQEIAVALSLLLVSNDLLWSLPGGAWYLLRLRRSAAASRV
jgi:uncharacterized protein (TIRG00374 family)